MSFVGIVRNGVVVLENNGTLPDGTRVQVIVTEPPVSPAQETTLTGLLELAGSVDDLPADMARNHDHYIHGAPKR
jgi:hypothetical protein